MDQGSYPHQALNKALSLVQSTDFTGGSCGENEIASAFLVLST